MTSLEKEMAEAESVLKEALKEGKAEEKDFAIVENLETGLRHQLQKEILPYRKKTLQSRNIMATLKVILPQGKSLKESDLSLKEKQWIRSLDKVSEDPVFPKGFVLGEEYEDSFYQGVFSSRSGFLFLLDGSVLLAEKNGGWEIRKKPIASDILIQKGRMITSSLAYLLDDEGNVLSLSYPRIDDVNDLLRINAYEI